MFPVAQLFITCAEFKNIKMADTITFDENNNGWSSRWSYKPEWMSRLNRGFFSFKKGQLYRHHDPMADRNLFYDDNGDLKEEVRGLYLFEISFSNQKNLITGRLKS